MRNRTLAYGLLGALLCAGRTYGTETWPQFRGPSSAGVAAGPGLPETWDTKTNVVWDSAIPGRGWSSPVVWGSRIFLTAAIQDEGEPEPVKPGLYLNGERPAPKERHRWVVFALDAETGVIRWQQTAHAGVPQEGHHLKNTLASETPVTDGKRLYAYFGNVGMFCYDFSGKLIWKRSWGSFPTHMGWGTAASPVIHDGHVYQVIDNEKKSFIVALDAATGDEVWRVDREEGTNWATPLVWQNRLRTELVVPAAGMNRSYALDGSLLWQLGGMSRLTIPTPVANEDFIYLSSGYVRDQRKPIFAVRAGATGDISLGEKETSNAHVAWSQKMAGPYNPSPVLYEGRLYVLYDRGMIACYDAKTGKEVYGLTRLGEYQGGFSASPWAYQDKIFCLSEGGETFVVAAGPQFKVVRVNRINELCMATPAVRHKSLLVRTESRLLRIEERSP